jgi:hypothetical protein
MNGAEGGREIAIDTDDEGQARGGGEIAGCAADGVERDEQSHGRQHPGEAEAAASSSMPLTKPSGPATACAGSMKQKRRGAADVADGEDDAADEQCPGNGAAGILNFIAHGGGALNGAEGEEDAGPEDGVVERPVGDEAGGRDVDGRSEAASRKMASRMSTVSGSRLPSAPMLLSHLPDVDAENVEQQ